MLRWSFLPPKSPKSRNLKSIQAMHVAMQAVTNFSFSSGCPAFDFRVALGCYSRARRSFISRKMGNKSKEDQERQPCRHCREKRPSRGHHRSRKGRQTGTWVLSFEKSLTKHPASLAERRQWNHDTTTPQGANAHARAGNRIQSLAAQSRVD